MTNQIRLKRGSGSNPSASDLAVGELAVRTDTGVLFTKDDGGSVITLGGGGGISDGDKGDITVSNSGDTFTIDNDAVTYAKMQNVSATDRLLGRDSSGAGIIEEIAPSAVRTMLGLATSATTDTTNASNISSGTIAAARVGDISGNAASSDTIDITGKNDNVTYYPTFVNNTGSAKDLHIDNGGSLNYNPSTNVLTAGTFSGSGASLTSLNGSNISSGTVAAARVGNLAASKITSGTFAAARIPTLNQNTTGSSASCTGNAATATKLATARSISGVNFDGTGNITLNNSNITNGAGYITSADGGNAATLDGIDSSQFLRSDTSDTMTGSLTIGDGSAQTELLIKKADNNVSDHLQFYNGTTRVGEIGCEDSTWLRINQETSKNIYTPRYIRADAGFFVDGTSKGINGSGNFIGGTIAGASDYSTLLRSNTADTASGDITFSGGAGAATIAANSDISFTNGSSWTGNHSKIQRYSDYLYIIGGGNGIVFREAGANRAQIDGDGNFIPSSTNSYNLGSPNNRWANLYVNDMHFANSVENPNKIDGTWGDWTLQEAEDTIFMLNNRNGKKYKMNLTEIV